MKFTGRYTAATAKALKGSPRLVCRSAAGQAGAAAGGIYRARYRPG